MARHLLSLSRRGALRGGLGLAALAACAPARRGSTQPGDPFTLGVASGDPTPDGMVLWTRLAPEALAEGGGMGAAPVEVAWELAEDEGFRRVVRRGSETARAEDAHSVHVELAGLPAGRMFFYRFTAMGARSPVGRTRTAPAPDAAVPVRFLNAGCQNWEHGHFTAWRHAAAEEDIAFVFHYGDYIYEYAGRPIGGRGWGPVVRSHAGPETVTLEQYRQRHAQYRTDPDLQAAHAAHPFVVTYDDHEVENNWVSVISQRDGGRRFPVATPPEAFALRLAAGLKAWWEHNPVRRAALPRGTEITAFRRLRFGRLLDLHVLDTRRFRDDQPCGDGVVAPCEATANPAAQVLGPAQEAWLRDGLRASEARWQVLAQQIFLAPRDFGNDARNMDSWDGYPAARARLLDALRGRDAAVLTGDVHRAWANDLLDAGGRVVGAEFVGTSITSEGDGSEAQPTAAATMERNPWLRFHSNRRGYTLHEARPDRLEAHFRAVDHVQGTGAPLVTKGRFATLAGRPGVVAL
ncbi:MAG: alkaline phosphatase D family protein [Acetobacteraceae bacterium]|nr:alkaline phosphatase D family protein [Acetobacteraceae bacterium]